MAWASQGVSATQMGVLHSWHSRPFHELVLRSLCVGDKGCCGQKFKAGQKAVAVLA